MIALTDMTEAVAVDAATLRLSFNGKQSARAILGISNSRSSRKRSTRQSPFDSSQINPPLGSGPYRVGRVVSGQTIEYERVEDYWGRDLAVNRGQNNFDRIRIEFYRDRQVAFEAFKKGDILFRQEFTSRTWATSYDFPAIDAGKVVKREFPGEKRPSMQATAVNQRRERFRDSRVRRAIAMCFDFEWTQRNIFYGSYERSNSCFERSDYKATGLPSADELALLEPLRGKVPEEVFGEAVTQPVSDGSGRDRKLLSQASKLLIEAGWKRDGNVFVNGKGERLTVEILIEDDVFIRADSPWVENMRAIGIDASIRQVDSAQYAARQASFDFDLISVARSFDATPTKDDIEAFFSVAMPPQIVGSRNLPGTVDPAVDVLIDAVGAAENRARPDRCDARARPGLARPHGLDSKLAFGESHGGVLGYVRFQGTQAGFWLSGRGAVVV